MGELGGQQPDASGPPAAAAGSAAEAGRGASRFTPWTARQRGVILALTAALLVALAVRWWRNPLYVPDPQWRVPPRAGELADRIDPNTADWQTLAALPMIGEKRARDIVAYRERFTSSNAGKPAFRRAGDLLRIRGFGNSIVAQIEPYLIFPGSATTEPASPPR